MTLADWSTGVLMALVGLAGLAALGCRWRALAGTTLRAPWYWAAVSLALLTACHVLAAGVSPGTPWLSHLRYAVAATTFCPLMAVLGAKRPQDRGWQFIVLSLWVILALPVGESLVDRPDEPLRLHAARQWFLTILIGVGYSALAALRALAGAVRYGT